MKRLAAWWNDFRGLSAIGELKRENKLLADMLHLANLEIVDIQKRYKESLDDVAKKQAQIQKLWGFIAIRHRIHEPAIEGTMRSILQKADRGE